MKSKLDLAHEWYMKHAGGADSHMSLEINLCWKYADAMYEQLEKRDSKGTPEVISNARPKP